jgi:cysteinyl-tRNA synthetase
MRLYNTLTREKETLAPLDGKVVRIYSCGPTVYNTASIGNLRAYVFTDVLKKAVEFDGLKIKDVMNLTDVGHLVGDGDDGEDKVEKSARALGISAKDIAKKYTDQFFKDCDKLNIRRPQIVAPATSYVSQMIDFVAALEKKGLTYNTSDGVYFDSSKFPNYNKLSRQPLDKNKVGARVDIGEKRNPSDFCLWKFVGENALQKWASPWGKNGCPGWHIECSAIARRELGDTFDIHTGGIDHIPIHHTNEIAQTESLTQKPMARFWLHNEFIMVDGKKMSKSLGNVYLLTDIESRGIDPVALRYLFLTAHYRSILNFTWEALYAAAAALDKLVTELAKHCCAENKGSPRLKTLEENARTALEDDLNTAAAIAKVWEMLKLAPSRSVYDAIIEIDKVLSLDLATRVKNLSAQDKDIPAEILELAKKRQAAKAAKDFKEADRLREQVKTLGYEIKDTKDSVTLYPKRG